MAFLAFLLFLLAIFGSVLQFVWYVLISLDPVAVIGQEFVSESKGNFVTSYIMLIITAMTTLTITRKLAFGYHSISAKIQRYCIECSVGECSYVDISERQLIGK